MIFRWLTIEEGETLWDRALTRFSGLPFSFLYGWRKIFEEALRLKTYYGIMEEDGEVFGLCPLVYMKSPWVGGGTFLLSLPYLTRGGVIALDQATRDYLIDRVLEKAEELKADFVELRELAEEEENTLYPANTEHVQMMFTIPEEWRQYEKEIAPRLRQVKTAQKAGLTVKRGKGKELLSDFYDVFSRRMRELSFPVYPKTYFRMILECFNNEADLALVYDQEKPLGGMLLFKFREICSAPYVATLVQSHSAHPNQLLYYTVIRQAWEEGYRTFDFCRSQIHSGTFTFKSQWRAKPEGLIYHYPLCKEQKALPTVGLAQRSLTFRLAEMIWPRLPLQLTQWLGGKLIRHLALA
jgi:FemAB-related protein (PEP-CTERM system-associated)